VGTARLSTSVHDRFCRLAVHYQDEESERGIVALRAPLVHDLFSQEFAERLIGDAVAVTRVTRRHPDLRQGASVRGAIDLALVARELLEMRGVPTVEIPATDRTDPVRQAYTEAMFDAMIVALSGRIHLDETTDSTPEVVLRQIWEDHFVLNPAAAAPG
jgi:MoxR-like ATPase